MCYIPPEDDVLEANFAPENEISHIWKWSLLEYQNGFLIKNYWCLRLGLTIESCHERQPRAALRIISLHRFHALGIVDGSGL